MSDGGGRPIMPETITDKLGRVWELDPKAAGLTNLRVTGEELAQYCEEFPMRVGESVMIPLYGQGVDLCYRLVRGPRVM